MSQERVVDIIDHVRKFYSQLSEYYDGLSAVADQERVKILLHYLSESEARHEQALADYETTAPDNVLNTWFKHGADKANDKPLEHPTLTADMDVDAVLTEALRLDQRLSDMYQEIIDRAESARVKDLFTSLLALHKQAMRDLSRDCGHLYDW